MSTARGIVDIHDVSGAGSTGRFVFFILATTSVSRSMTTNHLKTGEEPTPETSLRPVLYRMSNV
jgi:hypothetical protein